MKQSDIHPNDEATFMNETHPVSVSQRKGILFAAVFN